jgi:hypothetical protein
MFFLLEGGRAPRTCCWRRMSVLRTCTCDDLSTTTHFLQYRSSELDSQGTGDTEFVWVIAQFLSSGKGVRLGLDVEGEGGRLCRTCTWWSVYDYTSPSVSEFQARQARTRLYSTECVWVLIQFLHAGPDLAIPPSILSSWLTVWQKGKGAFLRGRAPLGRACSTLTNGWERVLPFW